VLSGNNRVNADVISTKASFYLNDQVVQNLIRFVLLTKLFVHDGKAKGWQIYQQFLEKFKDYDSILRRVVNSEFKQSNVL